ncbi:MAG: hypothetical protein ABIL09_16135 [Gemmatimonadota bacterium]
MRAVLAMLKAAPPQCAMPVEGRPLPAGAAGRARTLEEAALRGQAILGKGAAVDYSGMSVADANRVNATLERMARRYPNAGVRGVAVERPEWFAREATKAGASEEAKWMASQRIYAMANISEHSISLNARWFASGKEKEFTKRLAGDFKRRFHPVKNFQGVVSHEYGHHAYYAMNSDQQREVYVTWFKMKEMEPVRLRKELSRYAAEKPSEFFAEAVSARDDGTAPGWINSMFGKLEKMGAF